jgi:hypothetical protein
LFVGSLCFLRVIENDQANELRSDFGHFLSGFLELDLVLQHVFFQVEVSLAFCLLQSLKLSVGALGRQVGFTVFHFDGFQGRIDRHWFSDLFSVNAD